MIPHGVPDRDLITPDTLKARFGWEGRKVVLTFGLLAPNKGIETIIEALPAVAAHHPELLYVILGATHPNLIAHEGEAYRDRLKALAETRGVAGNVAFVDAFVDHDDLIEYLQAADIYATPYNNPAQITSGTLSYAVGVGKAVISTPYVHATEILADDHGVLVGFGDVEAFAREINRLLSDETARNHLSQQAYARGRTMIWPRLAEAALEQIGTAITARPRRLPAESLLDSLVQATGVPERFSGAPAGFSANQLPDGSVKSEFLSLFGKPQRMEACECERDDGSNMLQALHFINGKSILDRVAAGNGRVSGLLREKSTDDELIARLYLWALARRATAKEIELGRSFFESYGEKRTEAAQDLMWALLNSRDFMLLH